jgi:hypothetical protein
MSISIASQRTETERAIAEVWIYQSAGPVSELQDSETRGQARLEALRAAAPRKGDGSGGQHALRTFGKRSFPPLTRVPV